MMHWDTPLLITTRYIRTPTRGRCADLDSVWLTAWPERHAGCTLHAPSRGTRAAVPFRFMAGFAWYKVSRRGSYTYVHRPTWRTYHLTSRVREEGAGLVIHTSIVRSLFFPSADLGPARIRTWFDATHRESSHLATQVRLRPCGLLHRPRPRSTHLA